MRPRGKTSNQVRIIGGTHRGRRLSFPDLPGLRPTGDRVRETLFNWLQPILPGARCLDLFAGSGAIGLEAASRGAGAVVMLDQAPAVIKQLQQHVADLRLEQVQVERADALEWLGRNAVEPFDIVFLDPPFGHDLLGPCCTRLEAGGWLKPDARIYIEMDVLESLPEMPENWVIVREKKAGQVAYYLFSR